MTDIPSTSTSTSTSTSSPTVTLRPRLVKPGEFSPNADVDPHAWRSYLRYDRSSADPSSPDPLARLGSPQRVLANAILALEHCPSLAGLVGYDENAQATAFLRPAPWHSRSFRLSPGCPSSLWSDNDTIHLSNWMQLNDIIVGKEICDQAIELVARQNPFHPIHDYLSALEWDGEERIGQWLTSYLSSDNSEYTRAIGPRFLISAVARILKPGCKVDTCLILEGRQGRMKSTALETLAGPQWFTDDIPELGTKDAAIATAGVWIIEMAELTAIRNPASLEKIKAFLSRCVDNYRPPYGRRNVSMPRRCIFTGTTNASTYLHDDSGGRRFWPVETGWIDIDALGYDRDQLWAEAVVQYRSGAPWWLNPSDLNGAAEAEQRARYEPDIWEGKVREWLSFQPRGNVSIQEILGACLGKSLVDMTRSDQIRVAHCLQSLGWERYRPRMDSGKREYRYRRAE